MKRMLPVMMGVSLALAAAAATAEEPAQKQIKLAIQSQTLRDALNEWAQQTGFQLIFATSEETTRVMSPSITGTLSAEAALSRLLAGTRLTYEWIGERSVAIRERVAPTSSSAGKHTDAEEPRIRLAQLDGKLPAQGSVAAATEVMPDESDKPEQVNVRGIPEVLVVGSRLLNMDVRRTRDDIQPYVVFDQDVIKASGASNLQDFLKQRLTMNATTGSPAQGASGTGNSSEINLRGLGSNQTLVLVDGRRTAGAYLGGSLALQPDLAGIPLAAVERIEILPTTASGIYGGGATGGVVNVILRRDYSGLEATISYDSTFDGDSTLRRLDLAGGLALDGGKTNIQLSGSYLEDTGLFVRDREFFERGRARIMANNPGFFVNSATPPLGATTNIRSATTVGGVVQNLTLKDGTPLNSPITFVPIGYSGTSNDNGRALVANAGQYNFELAQSAQSGGGGETSLLNGPTVGSIGATIRREFTSYLDIFADFAISENKGRVDRSGLDFAGMSGALIPASAAHNPFQQDIRVTVPSADGDDSLSVDKSMQRATAGFLFQMPARWSGEADYAWSRVKVTTESPQGTSAATAIRTGTLNVLRDTNLFPLGMESFATSRRVPDFTSTSGNASVRIGGPVATLPAGPLMMTALVEHREDILADGTATSYTNSGPGTPFNPVSVFQEQKQQVTGGYVEMLLPVVGPGNGIPAVRELEFQLAGRHDSYESKIAQNTSSPGTSPAPRRTSKFTSTDPTVGFRYKPVRDVALRASYGTGLRPPQIGDLAPFQAPALLPAGFLIDPRRNNERTGAVLQTSGGNINVQPETSESWSAGLIYTPRFLQGLRISLDYTKIEKEDNISAFISAQTIVNNESLLPDRVTRGPATGTSTVGPILAVDTTALNLARAEIEAFDASVDFRLAAGSWGTVDLYTSATWQPHYRTQAIPGAPFFENAGIANTLGTTNAIVPLKLKLSGGAAWTYANWVVGWNTRYFDSYLVADPAAVSSAVTIANQGSRTVPSQIYHDLYVTYRAGGRIGILSGTEVQLGARNVFDEAPPFDAGSAQFYSLLGDPRLASYYLTFKVSF
jgi:iron complex outermembrane recepter protein